MSTSPDGVTTKLKYVLMDEASVETMQLIGGGNLSLGVREAARRLKTLGAVQASSYVAAPVKVPRAPPKKYTRRPAEVKATPAQIPTKGFLGGWR